jgi:low affinity Fe/Cu permease
MASKRIANIFSATTTWLGSTTAVVLSVLLVIVWFVGVFFIPGGFGNDSYQLVINSVTTIITFNMVFIIQNTTNRETKAMNAKLDAVLEHFDIDSEDPDFTKLISIEDETEEEIDKARKDIIDKTHTR